MQPREVDDGKTKEPPGLPKPTLLVVDEDSDDLLRYAAFLQRQDYQVRAISSFADAAACVEREDFDLIVVSQGTWGFEGRSVLARAIEKDRHAHVVVLSRSIDMPCYIEAMQSGALDYMEKPLAPSEIAQLVRKYLRTRSASA
jgi:two-component system C4-dicarboxylate transport response regulator DctD